MHDENDGFWRRTTQREELDMLRREREARDARGWRRNVLLAVLLAVLLGAIWLAGR